VRGLKKKKEKEKQKSKEKAKNGVSSCGIGQLEKEILSYKTSGCPLTFDPWNCWSMTSSSLAGGWQFWGSG
jgi:hypothetical protein